MDIMANIPNRIVRSRILPQPLREKMFWDKVKALTAEAYREADGNARWVISGSEFIGELCALSTFYGIERGMWGVPGYVAWHETLRDEVGMMLYDIDRGLA